MDYLRGSVNLRAYGQRDPLIEYRKDGKRMFDDMERAIADKVVELLPTMQVHAFEQDREKLHKQRERMQMVGGDPSTPREDSGQASSGQVKRQSEKVGRNDPCPCGAVNEKTGKVYKYKHCGLINAPHHKGS